MELREATEEESQYAKRFIDALPKIHRKDVSGFVSTIAGKTNGYYLVGCKWMIDDKAEMASWDEWYCPTQDRAVLCPGPCPDGTPHTKIE